MVRAVPQEVGELGSTLHFRGFELVSRTSQPSILTSTPQVGHCPVLSPALFFLSWPPEQLGEGDM